MCCYFYGTPANGVSHSKEDVEETGCSCHESKTSCNEQSDNACQPCCKSGKGLGCCKDHGNIPTGGWMSPAD